MATQWRQRRPQSQPEMKATSPLGRAVLQVTTEYEERFHREKLSLTRRIDNLEDERDGLLAQVKTLTSDVKIEKDAKLEALEQVEKMTAATAEAKHELKIERCRILGALFVIADLQIQCPQILDDCEDDDDLAEPKEVSTVKKKRRRRGGKKHKKSAVKLEEAPDDDDEEDESSERNPLEALALARGLAKRSASSSAFDLVDACGNGQIKAIEKVVRKTSGYDALYDAAEAVLSLGLDQASRAGHSRVCSLLLDHGARAERACVEPSALDEPLLCWVGTKNDQPALHAAIAGGFDDVAKMLITNGANANAVSLALGGSTPLHVAAAHNRSHLAHFLVAKCNARIDSIDDKGRTPVDVATELRWHAVAKVLKDPSVLFWARANRANRLCKEGEMTAALGSFDLALAELTKMKAQGKSLNDANVMTLHNNRAKALMALSRHLEARQALDDASHGLKADPTTYVAAFQKRCECDSILLDHAKAAAGYDRLADRYENDSSSDDDDKKKVKKPVVEGPKLTEWRAAAKREKAKLAVPPHEVLGVRPHPTSADLKKAYRAMSIKWHPDRHAAATPESKYRAHSQFQRIAAAYDTLLKRTDTTTSSWNRDDDDPTDEDDDEDLDEDDDDDDGDDDDDDDDDDNAARRAFWQRTRRNAFS